MLRLCCVYAAYMLRICCVYAAYMTIIIICTSRMLAWLILIIWTTTRVLWRRHCAYHHGWHCRACQHEWRHDIAMFKTNELPLTTLVTPSPARIPANDMRPQSMTSPVNDISPCQWHTATYLFQALIDVNCQSSVSEVSPDETFNFAHSTIPRRNEQLIWSTSEHRVASHRACALRRISHVTSHVIDIS